MKWTLTAKSMDGSFKRDFESVLNKYKNLLHPKKIKIVVHSDGMCKIVVDIHLEVSDYTPFKDQDSFIKRLSSDMRNKCGFIVEGYDSYVMFFEPK